MDTRRNQDLNGRFVTEADWIAGYWNYLLDLDRDGVTAAYR